MLIDDPWQFAFAFIGSIGSIATAIALGFLLHQSRQTQKQIQLTQQQTNFMQEQIGLTKNEMESTLRPWIGISDVEIQSNEFVTFHVKNYGRIPARIVRMRKVLDKIKISKDVLVSKKAENSETMLFPDEILKMSSILPEEAGYQYVAIMIEYEYGNNKNGEFGLIAKRVGKSGTIIYEEIFAR